MTSAARLLRWYDRYGRDLPWRKTCDPYRILVSEMMLQQTQVERVLFFYPRWLKKFPSWKKLAAASDADVIRAWAGLGYNRRALALKNIASCITQCRRFSRHPELASGHVSTKTEKDWLALKGIGPYTAAAVVAFAFHQRTFPIDTVIRRVAGRLLLGLTFPQPKNDDRLRRAAETFLPTRGRFYDVPQALFDLGAAVCKKIPMCAVCPMRADCKAAERFLSGRVRTPKAMIKKSAETRHANKPFPDRIFRGRILRTVRESPGGIVIRNIGNIIDPNFQSQKDKTWLANMIARLQRDGLIAIRRGRATLP